MAIQGLTPDFGSLASSWLLRLVASGPTHSRAPDGDSVPIPRGDRGDVPGELGSAIRAGSVLRGRLDAGGRICFPILPAGLLERPGPAATRSLHPPGGVPLGSEDRLPSLCRFLC
jgi:hypothetical protein